MKKLIYLFSLSALVLASCSGSDDSDNNTNPDTVLVKKMVATDEDGSMTTVVSYNGTKITGTVDSDGYHSTVTYTGNLITKWEDFDSDNAIANREIFEYNDAGQLVRYSDMSYEDDYGSVYTYVHNANGSISYSLETGDTASQSFNHDGLITATQYTEHYDEFDETYTKTFTYDDKNNPFKNIMGYDKIYFAESDEALNLANNVLTNTDSQSPDDATTSTYTYNDAGFPLTETELEFGTIQITTQYTYQ